MEPSHPRIIGTVKLWGQVMQHQNGWRAMFAYPSKLWVFPHPSMVAEKLEEDLSVYGVPVAVLPTNNLDEVKAFIGAT